MDNQADASSNGDIFEPRLWRESGWTAKVVKNEDDDGWAVEMYLEGKTEPALVGPWTMGRDKKNPKPLDKSAFLTLMKTAKEFIGRLEQQRRSALHKETHVGIQPERVFIHFDIIPDDDYPSAKLTAFDEAGNELAKKNVPADFKFSQSAAQQWADSGFA